MRYKIRFQAIIIGAFSAFLLGVGLKYAWSKWAVYDLPKEKIRFSSVRPSSSVEIVDRFNHPLHYVYQDDLLIYRPLSAISPRLKEFVVFLEDAKFYSHNGFDVEEIKNSLEKNLEKGKVKRGASTITQQLAKNLFLGKERTWTRKLFEVPWTLKLESDLTKSQILDLYLNVIEWGPGLRGAEAASRHFFDRSAEDLEIGQAMYLALIIPNPVRFDVLEHPHTLEFLKKKKSWMVERLVDEKRISLSEKEHYESIDFGIVKPEDHERFPLSHSGDYLGNRDSLANDSVRKKLEDHLKDFRGTGSKVGTTLDAALIKRLFSVEIIDADSTSKRFFTIQEDGKIRAFREIGKNKAVAEEQLSDLCPASYACTYLETLEWKNLAP